MSIKISQLLETSSVGNNDFFPVARGGEETFRIPARQFVTNAINIGLGPGQLFSLKTSTTPTTLRFRTLSATGENLSISTVGETVVFNTSGQNPIKTTFVAGTSTTSWPLIGFNSINAANYRVDFDGVLQEPFTDYNISSGNIIFTAAPPLSTKVVIVSNNMVRVNEAQPAPNTITNAMMTVNSIDTPQLSANAVTTDKIANGAVTTNKIANEAVSTSQLSAQAITTDKIALNAIGTAQLSAQSVTTLTIANSAITAEKMSGGQTGSAPVYGCRAWVNFDGTRDITGTISTANTNRLINGSGNVSSVLRTGTGDYVVNFTTFMPDANYSVVVTNSPAIGSGGIPVGGLTSPSLSLSSCSVRTTTTNVIADASVICVTVFR
jgi:hypothetical protein